MAGSKAPPCLSPRAQKLAKCQGKMRDLPGSAALQVLDRHHPIGVLFALFLDRQVLADGEALVLKPIARFIVVLAADVVVKGPAAPWLMDEVADLIVLVRPKARDPAGLAMCPPQGGIDAAIAVQRCDQFVAVTAAAGRMARFAREFEPDTAKFPRQLNGGFSCGAHGFLMINATSASVPSSGQERSGACHRNLCRP